MKNVSIEEFLESVSMSLLSKELKKMKEEKMEDDWLYIEVGLCIVMIWVFEGIRRGNLKIICIWRCIVEKERKKWGLEIMDGRMKCCGR